MTNWTDIYQITLQRIIHQYKPSLHTSHLSFIYFISPQYKSTLLKTDASKKQYYPAVYNVIASRFSEHCNTTINALAWSSVELLNCERLKFTLILHYMHDWAWHNMQGYLLLSFIESFIFICIAPQLLNVSSTHQHIYSSINWYFNIVRCIFYVSSGPPPSRRHPPNLI